MVSSCHNDLFWNHEHNICDWSNNVNCDRSRLSAPSAEQGVDGEVVPPIAGNGECNEGQYNAIPEDCSR